MPVGALEIRAEVPPLRFDSDGSIRVGATRITLDVIVDAFEQGMALDEIAEEYDLLDRSEVYSAIAFYLRHKAEVRAYLGERQLQANRLQKELEAAGRTPSVAQREALKDRWKSSAQNHDDPTRD
jgi:uncharacterized protein (DUF433 family)